MLELYDYQLKAIDRMKNGCVLAGETGTGKSRTALAYYFLKECGGRLKINDKGSFHQMTNPRDLYIITTAKKRDSHDWNDELIFFLLIEGPNPELRNVNVKIDSWNNIHKYRKVYGAFFIFDEQRVSGTGKWVKSFLDITKRNHWILLSATPGDTWKDYIPLFVANGFYKHATEFNRKHCVYSRYAKYPEIIGYMNEPLLEQHRDEILIPMVTQKKTIPHDIDIWCNYDRFLYRSIWKDRWDPFNNEPILETGKLFYLLRRVVNDDESRYQRVLEILETHRRAIIFYNFTYELQRLRSILTGANICTGEWNGELHTGIPAGDRWVYLVQYIAGAEGWNCISTDTIIFFSQSYSYRQTKQAEGRIDRANTPYVDLYYYKLKSKAPIDISIERALNEKQNFNENKYWRKNNKNEKNLIISERTLE